MPRKKGTTRGGKTASRSRALRNAGEDYEDPHEDYDDPPPRSRNHRAWLAALPCSTTPCKRDVADNVAGEPEGLPHIGDGLNWMTAGNGDPWPAAAMWELYVHWSRCGGALPAGRVHVAVFSRTRDANGTLPPWHGRGGHVDDGEGKAREGENDGGEPYWCGTCVGTSWDGAYLVNSYTSSSGFRIHHADPADVRLAGPEWAVLGRGRRHPAGALLRRAWRGIAAQAFFRRIRSSRMREVRHAVLDLRQRLVAKRRATIEDAEIKQLGVPGSERLSSACASCGVDLHSRAWSVGGAGCVLCRRQGTTQAMAVSERKRRIQCRFIKEWGDMDDHAEFDCDKRREFASALEVMQDMLEQADQGCCPASVDDDDEYEFGDSDGGPRGYGDVGDEFGSGVGGGGVRRRRRAARVRRRRSQ